MSANNHGKSDWSIVMNVNKIAPTSSNMSTLTQRAPPLPHSSPGDSYWDERRVLELQSRPRSEEQQPERAPPLAHLVELPSIRQVSSNLTSVRVVC
jgi:hypothetical protein